MARESSRWTTLRTAVTNIGKFLLGKRANLVRNIAWRVFKAILFGSFIYIFSYYIPTKYFSAEALISQLDLPPQVGQITSGVQSWSQSFLYSYTMILIFFTVAIQILSGTILQYAFKFGRAFSLMTLMIYTFHGGVIEATIPLVGATIFVKVNFIAFLAMIISVSLLGMAKSVLEAVNFLSEKEAPLEL